MSRSVRALALLGFVCAASPGVASAQYLVEGLRGPVTAAEIAAYKKEIKTKLASTDAVGPFSAFVGNRHNNYVYGNTADAVEGLIAMYEVTKDQEFMDELVWFADQMLLHRNDRFRKWTIFTGKVEPCWPNCSEVTPECQWYCGTEVGDVVGHIAAVAKMIVKNRPLWQKAVPGEDSLKLGGTYLERARGYLRECRVTLDEFLTPYFVDPPTKRFIWPRHPNYGDGSEKSIRARGKTVPWNQNTMLAGGYQNVAQSLELLGEEPKTVADYEAIVKAFTDAFFEKITKYTAMDQPVYNWSYASDDVGPDYRYDEDLGHGGYDFWGIYKAYVGGKAGITREAMLPFANTIRYVIIRPDGVSTANRVNGAPPDRGGLGSTWIYGAYLNHDFYEAIGATMIAGAKRDPMTAGRLLLAKSMNARGWVEEQSDGGAPTPPPARPDGGAAAPSDAGAARPPDAGASAPGDAGPVKPDEPATGSGGVGGRSSGSGGVGGSMPPPPEEPARPAKVGGCDCGLAAASWPSAGPLLALVGFAVALAIRRPPR
jgi:hypothetical protein